MYITIYLVFFLFLKPLPIMICFKDCIMCQENNHNIFIGETNWYGDKSWFILYFICDIQKKLTFLSVVTGTKMTFDAFVCYNPAADGSEDTKFVKVRRHIHIFINVFYPLCLVNMCVQKIKLPYSSTKQYTKRETSYLEQTITM